MVGEDQVTEPRQWLRWLMDHIQGQVAFGDTKAGLLLAADSILLAALGSLITSDHPGFSSLSGVTKVLLGLSFLALIIALVLGLQTILPNRKNLQAGSGFVNFSWIADQPPKSFVSMARQANRAKLDDSIADQPPESFVSMAREANRTNLDDSIASVIHGTAQWAKRKFWLLYFAARATQLAVVLGLSAAAAELLAR